MLDAENMNNSIIKSQAGLVRELIDSANDVGIILGENHNIDTVGAALALYIILQAEGKSVQIVSKKDPIVEVANLIGIDKITKTFSGNAKIFTISVPYHEGDIEKVSYNIEGDRLNVNLFAEEHGININENDIQYIRKGSSPSLIITVGVLSEAELSAFVDPKAVRTIHIDRSPMNELIGDVTLIDPSFSSVSEIAAEAVRELQLLPDIDAFQNLMDGITYATRNFTLPQTSAFAFEAAGFLLQNGAKRKEKSPDRSSDRFQNQPQRRDRVDRPRSFPNPSHFLNQRPPRVGSGSAGQGSNAPQNTQAPNPPKADPFDQASGGNQAPQPYRNPQITPKASGPVGPLAPREASGLDVPDEVSEPSFTEGSMPEDIPDDWFLPKVFKGSKKGN